MYIPVDVKVIEGRAARVATNVDGDADQILGRLTRAWHRCWAEKTERLTRAELAGIFGRQNLDIVIEALIAEEFLCPCACVCTRCATARPRPDSYRIGGAHKFTRLRKAYADGGRKTQARIKPRAEALRQSPDPEIPRDRDPESASPPDLRDPKIPKTEPIEGAEGLKDYWLDLEASRQVHCQDVGMPAKGNCRCKTERQVELLTHAREVLGLTGVESWRQVVDELFDAYLADEQLGLHDRDGKKRDQPWPIPVFLNERILQRLQRESERAH